MNEVGHINYAAINLTNLRNNYNIIKKIITPPAGVICVVKADAYGHGIRYCAEALYEEGARFFAVATITEALELRKIVGSESDILIMGYTPWQYANVLSENDIIQTVYSSEYAHMLNNHADSDLRVHVKVNTGMNRLGFNTPEDLISVKSLKYLRYEGVYTHFACSDNPADTLTMNQYRQFINFIDSSKIEFKITHSANSGAIINFPETHLDAVRAGIILYGLKLDSHSPDITDYGMKPVMTLISTVSHIQTLKRGETVGYGATFTAQRDMKIITVSMGYADGFIRAYNKGMVTVNGKLLPVIGRICMDQFMAYATDVDVNIGDRVYIFGDDALMKAEHYAELASTINYETVCTISKRVPRVVLE